MPRNSVPNTSVTFSEHRKESGEPRTQTPAVTHTLAAKRGWWGVGGKKGEEETYNNITEGERGQAEAN